MSPFSSLCSNFPWSEQEDLGLPSYTHLGMHWQLGLVAIQALPAENLPLLAGFGFQFYHLKFFLLPSRHTLAVEDEVRVDLTSCLGRGWLGSFEKHLAPDSCQQRLGHLLHRSFLLLNPPRCS